MLFPLIVIKDRSDGAEHIVGTDRHDVLLIDDFGKIAYYNMQNSCSTEDAYDFKGVKDNSDLSPFNYYIKMVTFDELQEIYIKRQERDEKRKKKLEGILSVIFG